MKASKVQQLTDAELRALDASWRAGWALEFPGEPYPGLVDARRRIREKLAPTWPTTPPADPSPPR